MDPAPAPEISFVKQVAPTVEDLTDRRTEAGPRAGDYPTGFLGRRVPRLPRVRRGAAPPASARRCSPPGSRWWCRGPTAAPQVLAQGLVRAVWTDDMAASTWINPQVAHYTGQAELAQAIQQGLDARKAGDMDGATAKLGRAVQLASASGNEDTAKLLAKVVDVVDAASRYCATEGKGRGRRRDDPRDAVHEDRSREEVTRRSLRDVPQQLRHTDRRRGGERAGTMPTCPNGHQSGSDDWCEVCGHPHGAVPPSFPASPGPAVVGGFGLPPQPPGGIPPPVTADPPEPTAQAALPAVRHPARGGAPFCEECRCNFQTHYRHHLRARQLPPDLQSPRPAAGPARTRVAALADQPTRRAAARRAVRGPDRPYAESAAVGVGHGDLRLRGTSCCDSAERADCPAPAAQARPQHLRPPRSRVPRPPTEQGRAWLAVIGRRPGLLHRDDARSGPEASGLSTCPPSPPSCELPLTGNQITIGRHRHSTGESPDIDLSAPPEDPGVSHKHAVLVQQPDGAWAVVDQDSTNGTTVNLAEDPIPAYTPVPLAEGDRVHVGAWTTISDPPGISPDRRSPAGQRVASAGQPRYDSGRAPGSPLWPERPSRAPGRPARSTAAPRRRSARERLRARDSLGSRSASAQEKSPSSHRAGAARHTGSPAAQRHEVGGRRAGNAPRRCPAPGTRSSDQTGRERRQDPRAGTALGEPGRGIERQRRRSR